MALGDSRGKGDHIVLKGGEVKKGAFQIVGRRRAKSRFGGEGGGNWDGYVLGIDERVFF